MNRLQLWNVGCNSAFHFFDSCARYGLFFIGSTTPLQWIFEPIRNTMKSTSAATGMETMITRSRGPLSRINEHYVLLK